MLRLLPLIFVIAGALEASGDDELTVSPQHTFEIAQTYKDKDGWKENLHFLKDKPEKDIVLEYGIWPALYYISPDDKWIVRIQKSGSGENISYLYKVDSDQSIWRLERQIGEHALTLLSHRPGGLPSGLYHEGIEFGSWDLNANTFHFTVWGSGENGTGLHEALIYNLKDNSIAPDPHPPKAE